MTSAPAWAGAAGLALGCLAALWGWCDPRLAAAWWALAALCGGP